MRTIKGGLERSTFAALCQDDTVITWGGRQLAFRSASSPSKQHSGRDQKARCAEHLLDRVCICSADKEWHCLCLGRPVQCVRMPLFCRTAICNQPSSAAGGPGKCTKMEAVSFDNVREDLASCGVKAITESTAAFAVVCADGSVVVWGRANSTAPIPWLCYSWRCGC